MSMGVIPFNWNERYSRLEKPGIHSKSLVNFRNNDRKRAKEYKKELEEMKKRIQRRPYLFEQVPKVNLKYHLFSVLDETALRNYETV